MTLLDAALAYAARGWPVFPWGTDGVHKFPLTEHALLDATCDQEEIRGWCRRWPNALFAIATGERSGVVALDIDLRPDYSGFDSLEEIGISRHPETMTAHTPQGGCHVLFRWPGHFVKTIAGKLGKGLDVRGDGGSAILPPGPGRYWDPHLGPDTLLKAMPEWMQIVEPESPAISETAPPIRPQQLSRYAEAALDGAIKSIVSAPAGQQRDTLNREIYSIARLAAGGAIPAGLAIEALRWGARQLRSHDPRRPWRPADLDKMVRAAFTDGLARPRQPGERA